MGLFDEPTPTLNNNATISGAQYLSKLNTAGTASATVFFFSPRQIPDQHRRPYDYKFGEGFYDAVEQRIDNRMKGAPSSQMDSYLLDCPEARMAIMPSTQGIPTKLSSLSDFWTFLIVIDNDSAITPAALQSVVPSRTLLSGWCVNEPVTKTNFSQGYTPNPMCLLTVTHQTVLNFRQSFGMGGFRSADVMSDYDYAPYSVLYNIQSEVDRPFDLNPATVSKAVIANKDLEGTVSVAHMPLPSAPGSVTIGTELADPIQHLSTLVNPAIDTPLLGSDGRGSGLDNGLDFFSGGSVMQSTYSALLGNAQPQIYLSKLDVEQPFTVSELQQTYPNLNIQVINIPVTAQYDQTSNAAPTRNNVLTSMLASAFPGILAQHGLAEVAFRYNSSIRQPGGLGSIGGKRGMYELQNISTLYNCNQNTIQAKWNNLQAYLELDLFPIILNTAGHFDLMVHCSIGGVSLIHLNLLDFASVHGFVETNNLLGGLNTPLVGTVSNFNNNAIQLANFTRRVLPSGEDNTQPSLFADLF